MRRIEERDRFVLTAPPGAGKTVMCGHVIERTPGKCVFAAHRHFLVEQTQQEFDAWGVDALVTTTNAMDRRAEELMGDAALVIQDEVHMKRQSVLEWFYGREDAPAFMGVTATPMRTWMGGVFPGGIVSARTSAELEDDGYLVPLVAYASSAATAFDRRALRKSSLEFTGLSVEQQARKRVSNMMEEIRRIQDQLWPNRGSRWAPMLAATATIEQGAELVAKLRAAGVNAVQYYAGQRAGERLPAAEARRRMAAGELDAIVSVDVISQGSDFPQARLMLDCRPRTFRGGHVNQIHTMARVSRPLPEGCPSLDKFGPKPEGYVLDFAGNYDHHWGRYEQYRENHVTAFPVELPKEDKPVESAPCPGCGRHVRSGAHECAGCGLDLRSPCTECRKPLSGWLVDARQCSDCAAASARQAAAARVRLERKTGKRAKKEWKTGKISPRFWALWRRLVRALTG